jgi:hypothetical protein
VKGLQKEEEEKKAREARSWRRSQEKELQKEKEERMSQEMETQLLHSLAGLVQKIGQDCKVYIVYLPNVHHHPCSSTQKTNKNSGFITHIYCI